MSKTNQKYNPVHTYGAQWWFWDDSQITRIGPFFTEEAAEVCYSLYGLYLQTDNQLAKTIIEELINDAKAMDAEEPTPSPLPFLGDSI